MEKKEKKIRKLLEILRFPSELQGLIYGMVQNIISSGIIDFGGDITDGLNKINEIQKTTEKEVLDEVVKMYADHFSEKEIDKAIGWFSSPLGKKTQQVFSLIIDSMMELAQTTFLKNFFKPFLPEDFDSENQDENGSDPDF